MRRFFILVILNLLFLFGNLTEAAAQFWGSLHARPYLTPSDSLKHGEFTWNAEISPTGPLLVVVSLDEQRAYTYRNGILFGIATISSGKKGHESPTGVFHTILKDANHRSKKYNNAPMPYTQKITQTGVALHAGGLPGYPSSHGCIHLPSEYARLLFKESTIGMTVVVSQKSKFPEFINHPSVLSPVDVTGKPQQHETLVSTETFRWNPEKSKNGPLSILISSADKRLIVSRNGIEIGRSKIDLKNELDSIGTTVFIAHNNTIPSANSGNSIFQEFKWLSHPVIVPLHGYHETSEPLSQIERVIIPENFLTLLAPSINEGTTIVFTDAPILSKTSGKKLAVLSSYPGS